MALFCFFFNIFGEYLIFRLIFYNSAYIMKMYQILGTDGHTEVIISLQRSDIK